MFITRKPTEKSGIDDAIANALKELVGHEAHTEEYAQVVDQIAKLHEMKSKETPDRLSKDTLALVLGNLAGVVVIVGYEHKHVITSKALSLIGKLK